MLCGGGRGPQTACEPLSMLRRVSVLLLCRRLPRSLRWKLSLCRAPAPQAAATCGCSSCCTFPLLKGFLALLRLCFFPRFWMSQMATGHQRLPGEALETQP